MCLEVSDTLLVSNNNTIRIESLLSTNYGTNRTCVNREINKKWSFLQSFLHLYKFHLSIPIYVILFDAHNNL